jgi:GTP cyclohydrolase I
VITEDAALAAVRTLISYIGDDPARPGLRDTPKRVLRAWRESWGAGYQLPPTNIITLFQGDREQCDEMVVLRGIQFHSHCEHHMAPFFGTVDIGYIPAFGRGVLGLSKLARIVAHVSRQLQVQERLTAQVADYIAAKVSADVAVLVRATHTCMTSRGVQQPNTTTITSALRGKFFDDPTVRAEFLRLTAS